MDGGLGKQRSFSGNLSPRELSRDRAYTNGLETSIYSCGAPPDDASNVFNNMLSIFERGLEKDFAKASVCAKDLLFLQLDKLDSIYSVEEAIYFKMMNFDLHKVTVSSREKQKLILSTLKNNGK